jgi:hypothetical protein
VIKARGILIKERSGVFSEEVSTIPLKCDTMLYYRNTKGNCFRKRDEEMGEILRRDFAVLNENNRKNIIEMTKFLVLTQNTIVPGFLEEKGLFDTSMKTGQEVSE